MSSINEAYARIDYEALINIQQTIRELQSDFNTLIGRKAIANIQGESLSVARTRIYAERKSIPKGQSEVTIDFGPNRFESIPVLTATLFTINNNQTPSDVSVVIRSLTRTNAKLEIQRKVNQTIRLNIIAVGEAKESSL